MDHFATERMTAERLRPDHLADLTALHLDFEVSRYLGGARSAERTRAYLDENMAHWEQHGFGLWALRLKDGTFAGRAGIRHVMLEGVDEVEIAYTFTRANWGVGLASEIAASLTKIAFERFALPSLVGLVELEHVASRHVLEKLGYGLERDGIFFERPVAIYRKRAVNTRLPS